MKTLTFINSVVILFVAIVNGARSQLDGTKPKVKALTGIEEQIYPNNPDVQDAVRFIFNYIKGNKIINLGGDFKTVLEEPFMVNGTQQIVSGTLYRLNFDIVAEAFHDNTISWKDSKLYECFASVWDQPWETPRYTWPYEKPECTELDISPEPQS